MSRRFGRSQKRLARSEVATAKAEAELYAAVARDNAQQREEAQSEADELRSMLDDIASRMGRYAIASGVPNNFEADWMKRGKGNFQMSADSSFPSNPTYGARMYAAMKIHQETMRLLEVETVRNHFSRQMHCRVTLDEHDIGYAISDLALSQLTAAEIERRLAPEIARLLVLELKGAR